MSEQYQEYIATGIMPQQPNWEYFKSMGHKDLDYYTSEYNIMRLEDQWIMKKLDHDDGSMDQTFGMVEVGTTDAYKFIDNILGDDIVWSVQKRNDKSRKIHVVNVYGPCCTQVEDKLKNQEYVKINPYHYIVNTREHGTINIDLMFSTNASVSKYYHRHNMKYDSYTIVYKGIEYMTKRQLFYMSNKDESKRRDRYLIEIGVNDNKFYVLGRRSLRIPNYDYKNIKIDGLDKKNKYQITSDISLATFWALVTSGYKIELTKEQKRGMRRTKYPDMDEFVKNIKFNDLQYVKLER